MATFLHPALLFGLAAVAVPVLIHLINLMRHRRVEWAAMEFLLESHKRNSRWIVLKELILLALRMAAVAAVVLMLSQPLLTNQLGRLLGGNRTHHVVLLDDSYSMTERFGGTSVWNVALDAVNRLGGQAAARRADQRFSLATFSQAARTRMAMNQEQVNVDFAARLDDRLKRIRPTQGAFSAATAVEAVERMLGGPQGEERVVYLVSDFRTREWDQPDALKKALAAWNQSGVQVVFVDCTNAPRANVAVSALAPLPGTRAAGVPGFVEVGVTNYGPTTIRNVEVTIKERELDQPWRTRPDRLLLDEIPPGKTETERVPVLFTTAGSHEVAAELVPDAVAADNARYTVVEIPASVPVLIVDPDPAGDDAFVVASVLSPPGSTKSGIAPVIESTAYLNTKPLESFHAIYLLNLAQLDAPAVDSLTEYVEGGGGLAIFVGEQTIPDKKTLNERFHAVGEGLIPLAFDREVELVRNPIEDLTDLVVTDQPVFRIFADERNSFLKDVIVERYVAPTEGWQPDPQTSQVIATLRNGDPLVVERKLGEGRVVTFLTTAGPRWNNWARNPSFVVGMQELQAYLATSPTDDETREVGAALAVRLDQAKDEPNVEFALPAADGNETLAIEAQSTPDGLVATLESTDYAGVYQATISAKDGTDEIRRFAYNVVPQEGDLRRIGSEQLAERLKGVRYQYQPAASLVASSESEGGFNLSEGILYMLVGLLVGEQGLAYAAGYHRRSAGGGRG